MNYWKGLLIAVVIDAAWIMGNPTPTAPDPVRAMSMDAVEWRIEPVASERPALDQLQAMGRLEDSLMMHLQQHPEDVDAMAELAHIYAENEWHDPAIGPLARALQLDPSRRSLWSALDKAVEKSGMAKITDAELTRRAAQFVEAVEMWGHGC